MSTNETPVSNRYGWSIRSFRETFDVGNTTAFRLLKEGTLKRVKVGRKTIITDESVQAWWQSLQKAS